jgi:hypothetical protein
VAEVGVNNSSIEREAFAWISHGNCGGTTWNTRALDAESEAATTAQIDAPTF